MKTKFLGYVVKTLSILAVVCAATPSRLGMYEPQKPDCLK